MIYVFLAIGLFFLSFIFAFAFKRGNKKQEKSPTAQKETAKCPLCSGELSRGAVLFSTIYGRETLKVRDARIKGCTNCLAKDSTRERKCPICGTKIGKDESVAARVFSASATKKMHVIVNGCAKCRKARK